MNTNELLKQVARLDKFTAWRDLTILYDCARQIGKLRYVHPQLLEVLEYVGLVSSNPDVFYSYVSPLDLLRLMLETMGKEKNKIEQVMNMQAIAPELREGFCCGSMLEAMFEQVTDDMCIQTLLAYTSSTDRTNDRLVSRAEFFYIHPDILCTPDADATLKAMNMLLEEEVPSW